MQNYNRLVDAERVHGKYIKKIVYRNKQGVWIHAAKLQDGTTVETDHEGMWSVDTKNETILELECSEN